MVQNNVLWTTMGMSTENRSVTRTSANTVRGVMLVQWASRQRFRLLMVEQKKVSSCVNYRWLRGSECERNRNWGQWSAWEKSTAGRKTKCHTTDKCVCVCVFVIKEKKREKGEWEGKEKTEGEKQLLLMTYIERCLREDRKRTISPPMKPSKCLCWVWWRTF